MTKLTKWISLIATLVFVLSASAQVGKDVKHFNPKGKLPSQYTIEKQQALRKSLPFEDKRD
ncbi:MAG: hypothetical protein ACWGP1_17870, partial [Syntrophobacteria bacterium]